MHRSLRLALFGLAVAASATGCLAGTPGMVSQPRRPHDLEPSLDELARVEHADGRRALLVVYPRTACAGSARMVIMDEKGTFFGSVGPGEAALLTLPAETHDVVVLSNVEVTAPVGVWSASDEVHLPPPPSGLLFEAYRANARQCGSGQYAGVNVATKAELETALGESEIQWVQPRPAEGQAWIDAHRKRVDEVLGRQAAKEPAVVTHHVHVR